MYYVIAWISKVYLKIFHNLKIVGRENMPEGACVISPNHCGSLDPFAISAIQKPMMYYMAKIEIDKNKLLSAIAKSMGCLIFVNRGKADVNALKKSLKVLRNGEKLVLFPQGHRYKEFQVSQGKKGAATLAIKVDCPIVPVTIHRKRKGIFKKIICEIHKPIKAEGRNETEFITAVMERIGETL